MICNPGYDNRYMPQPAHGTILSSAAARSHLEPPPRFEPRVTTEPDRGLLSTITNPRSEAEDDGSEATDSKLDPFQEKR